MLLSSFCRRQCQRPFLCRLSTAKSEQAAAHKIAVLIDGDNAESSLISEVIAEASRFGKVTTKRCYGDWMSPQMTGWKNQLNSHGVRPIQKFAYTSAKNSTDTALIIDAMDLMHSKVVDGFCIVSSDSDFTGLSLRIREEGLFVMGIGRSHTPEAFVKSCETFTYSHILKESKAPPTSLSAPIVRKGSKTMNIAHFRKAFNSVMDMDTGLVRLSRLSESLRSNDSTFDPRDYGYTTFRMLCEAIPGFKIIVSSNDQSTMYLQETNTSKSQKLKESEASSTLDSSSSASEKVALEQFQKAFDLAVNKDTGLTTLKQLSNNLKSDDPTFDPRDYGYNNLRMLAEAMPGYETVLNGTTVYFKETNTNKLKESCAPSTLDSSSSASKKVDIEQFRKAFDLAVNKDTGVTTLSQLSKKLKSDDPTFDPRDYGYTTFRMLCEAIPGYETVSKSKTIYLQETDMTKSQ